MSRAAMPRKLPRHCVEDVDRYGNVRIYLRRKGRPKVRLEGVPWSEPFMRAYHAHMADEAQVLPAPKRHAAPNTWRWLCQQYLASTHFRTKLDPGTQRARRAQLEATYEEPIKPGSASLYGNVPLDRLTPVAIRVLRDRRAAQPEGANNRLKAIRGVFKWALDPTIELAAANPARDVPLIKVVTDGFHAWSLDEIRRFIERHPIGSKAYLALCLLMFAGGRRADVILLGRQHMQAGWLRYTQHKGRNTKPMELQVPILPALQAAIDAHPSGNLTLLVTSHGKPFGNGGFGAWFKRRCKEAGLPHCSGHGLRKAGATVAAENGATEKQLMAMFGWRSPQMAALYTRKAERKRLAGEAMHLIDFERSDVPFGPSGRPGWTIRA